MYGNYPTGYSYIAISISGRPDRDGRAVWEEGKDTAADKEPSLGFFFFLCWWKMWIAWLQACTRSPFFCSSLSCVHIHSLKCGWICGCICARTHTHTHTHTDNTPVRENGGYKKTQNKTRELLNLWKKHCCQTSVRTCLRIIYSKYLTTNNCTVYWNVIV